MVHGTLILRDGINWKSSRTGRTDTNPVRGHPVHKCLAETSTVRWQGVKCQMLYGGSFHCTRVDLSVSSD